MALSNTMRDCLIEHIDGPVPIDRRHYDAGKATTLAASIRAGLIRYEGLAGPRRTALTERGREALAKALADWAEALVPFGFDFVDREARKKPRKKRLNPEAALLTLIVTAAIRRKASLARPLRTISSGLPV